MARTLYEVKSEYLGAGNLATYTFDFKIEALTQLQLIKVNNLGVQVWRIRGDDTTYISSVTFDAVDGGGTVVLLANVESNYRFIMLLANDSPTQPSEFRGKLDFTQKRIETALDWLAGAVQRVSYLTQRGVRVSDLDDLDIDDFDPALPPGVAENTLDLIPAVTEGGWAPIADWTPVTDLAAAVAAAAAAAISQAAAAVSEGAAAVSAAAALASQNAAASSASAAAASAVAALASQVAAAASAVSAAASAVTATTQAAAAVVSAADAAVSAAAASVSEIAAELAETNAETAEVNAELAEANAETAATAAAASAAAALASEIAASTYVAAPVITGTRAAPSAIVAGTGIAFTGSSYFNIWFVQGSGGAVDISANPQIAAGTNVGQRLMLIGRSDTNTVKLEDGTGIKLKGGGEMFLYADTVAQFIWDGSNWIEIGV